MLKVGIVVGSTRPGRKAAWVAAMDDDATRLLRGSTSEERWQTEMNPREGSHLSVCQTRSFFTSTQNLYNIIHSRFELNEIVTGESPAHPRTRCITRDFHEVELAFHSGPF